MEDCIAICFAGQRAVLIDTGLDIANIKEVVDYLTNQFGTVITMYAHWDHIGGHKFFLNFVVHEDEVIESPSSFLFCCKWSR